MFLTQENVKILPATIPRPQTSPKSSVKKVADVIFKNGDFKYKQGVHPQLQ